MLIDWFTVGAQALNFIVLILLLKRFLYRPILDGIDAREQHLQKVESQASQDSAKANLEYKALTAERADIETTRSRIVAEATEQAEAKRRKLIEEAQQTADQMLKKQLQGFHTQLASMQQDIINKNVSEVYATCKKLLSELASVTLEQLIIDKFLSRLNRMPKEKLPDISSVNTNNYSVYVRSAFELEPRQKQDITSCLGKQFDLPPQSKLAVQFNHVPHLITGIEININGWKMCWSAEHYLDDLQQQVKNLTTLHSSSSSLESDQPEAIQKQGI